jgi:hypothetical protein
MDLDQAYRPWRARRPCRRSPAQGLGSEFWVEASRPTNRAMCCSGGGAGGDILGYEQDTSRRVAAPLSSEHGAYKTVKAKFWPRLVEKKCLTRFTFVPLGSEARGRNLHESQGVSVSESEGKSGSESESESERVRERECGTCMLRETECLRERESVCVRES